MKITLQPSSRRGFLGLGASLAAGVLACRVTGSSVAFAASPKPVIAGISDAEWRKRLSRPAYAVLRQAATESPFSSPLNDEHRKGIFACAGCALPLFSSATKFDSHTGWPSFYDHLPKAIGTQVDSSLFMTRTEVHCSRCSGHLGHVFDDGPQPTGLRYCMNGVAMSFRAA